MKRILFILTILSVIIVTSCGSDDDPVIELGLSGTLTYDGNTVTISDGLFGEVSEEGEYAATFFISDADLSYNPSSNQANFQGEVLVNVLIYSESDAFEAGNYDVVTLDGEVADKSALVLFADVNNASEGGAFATGGTINIQGSGTNFTLTFAVDFDNDIELVGSVNGNFERIEIPE